MTFNLKIYILPRSICPYSYNFLEDYKEYTQPEGCLSLQKKSYETLEFLGDSLLGCMTAEYLFLKDFKMKMKLI